MRQVITIFNLTILLFLIDLLLRPVYPTVDLLRASMVGVIAYAALYLLAQFRPGLMDPLIGAIAIFASAFLSVLLIQGGLLISQTMISAVVHVAILAVVSCVMPSFRGTWRAEWRSQPIWADSTDVIVTRTSAFSRKVFQLWKNRWPDRTTAYSRETQPSKRSNTLGLT